MEMSLKSEDMFDIYSLLIKFVNTTIINNNSKFKNLHIPWTIFVQEITFRGF
jgi:hypothetical protein